MWEKDEPTIRDAEDVLKLAEQKGLNAAEVIWNLLLQSHLKEWLYQRLTSDGGGRIKEIKLRRLSYDFTTRDDDHLEFSHGNSGSRWWHCGGLISRTDVERLLGVWPGYIDAVEDLTHSVAQLFDELEHEKSEYANRLDAKYEEERKRLMDWCADYGEAAARRAANERHPELRKWREKNQLHPESRPAALRHVRHVKRLEDSAPCYVYFLLLEGRIVYVGQTTAAWPTRILSHLKDANKHFDDVWYLEVDRPSLFYVERRFIKEFDPLYNRTYTTSAAVKRLGLSEGESRSMTSTAREG